MIFRTVKYLKDHNYFGMPEDQVYVMMQDCIPAVRNIQGEIACDSEGHIIRKPHGHGDVHFCLYRVSLIDLIDCRIRSSNSGLRNMICIVCSFFRIPILLISIRCLV